MAVDYDRIAAIIEELRPLDEYQAYYVKDTIRCKTISPLMPPVAAILQDAFACSRRVLDVGCGDGHTLLENAELFELGIGLDESAEHMLAIANARKDALGIPNVEFRCGKAIALPFADGSFDLVFSERGPLGHHDGTLAEALRVLQPGGLIFVETGGDFNTLQVETARFRKQGVTIHLAAAFTRTLVFPDPYEFFRHYCVNWCTYAAARAVQATDRTAIDRIILDATDADGNLFFRWNGVLLGGRKSQGTIELYRKEGLMDSVTVEASAGEQYEDTSRSPGQGRSESLRPRKTQ